ncbi:transmembrane protein 272 isoform X1 [Pleuronectes platessa]|uniref:transmembrane protein 272 isoform X1 n=2 Tax=Pleuronectes platessa TaxID=8262 RepID=UPI00232A171F|nr:transmembrane protein 272 isoform X1 [Pleuronectes platessa]
MCKPALTMQCIPGVQGAVPSLLQLETGVVGLPLQIRALATDTMTGFVESIPRPPQPKGASLGFSKLFGCAIPIAQIAIGSVYLDDCPVQPYIPIYLIVSGVFGVMLALLTCMPFSQTPEDCTSSPIKLVCVTWNSLSSCFFFCWFIAGNVWIYSIYEPEYVKNSTNLDVYCDKTLYLFAFWTTTLGYILFGVILLSSCCFMVYHCLCD